MKLRPIAMKKIVVSILFLFCLVRVNAADPGVEFSKGNELYQKGKYEDAAKIFEAILLSGNESEEVYYNLGNAYYKQNKLPQAILNYERALRLAPGNDDIRFNIRVTNARIVDKIEPMPEIFYVRWAKGLKALFSSDGWGRTSILLLLMAIAAGIFYLLSDGLGSVRKLGLYFSILALVGCLISLAFGYNEFQQLKEAKAAIVFVPTLNVKSSPSENGTNIFVVHEGTKVELEDRVGNWVKIRLADGNLGWVPEVDVVVI